jgi:hypothetical protein
LVVLVIVRRLKLPYIPKSEREKFHGDCVGLGIRAQNHSQLAYIFYQIGIEFLRKSSKTYQNKSGVKAALHDAMSEWQRQILDKHEDKKIIENGAIE